MFRKFSVFVCTLIIAVQELGVALAATQVVHGINAKPGERPFQISLQTRFSHICGGSIINRFFVVTAAHCTAKHTASDLAIVSGTTDLRKPYRISRVAKRIVHESYNPQDHFRNDISLLRVVTPFEFNFFVQPVRLPALHEPVKAGTAAVISGWGRLLNKNSDKPFILQKALIYVTDQRKCSIALNGNIFPTSLCANDPNIRRGSCNGDSGGPLTSDGKLIGLVSWGTHDPDCASDKHPTVYTRIAEYIDWIQSHQT